MKPELLESLLIDRALGELPPATGELLEAYLRHDPAAALAAESWQRTWQTAREAVRRESATPAALPEPEFLRQPDWRGWARRRRGEALRLAACLTVGLGIGWAIRTDRPEAAAPARRTPPAALPVARSEGDRPARTPGFWSLARLAPGRLAAVAGAGAAGRYRVRWETPAKLPTWEDNQ